jgi:3-hydroxyisobutyrate dehydrogenase-like beta-hydroxyacid dehydrogenase
MGAAVATTFLNAGHTVAVWNRSPEKAKPLAALGALHTSTAAEAVRASLLTVLVVLDAAAASETLATAHDELGGKTIVNFSGGPTDQVEALADLVRHAGGQYVQGSIIAYPRNIGYSGTTILYSGDAAAFAAHRLLLGRLSGQMPFLSEQEASALGAAVAVQSFVAMGGFYEAVAAASRLGLGAAQVASDVAKVSRFFMLDAIDDARWRLEQRELSGDQATIDVTVAGIGKLAASLGALGAKTPMFDAFLAHAKNAQKAGFGGNDIAAIAKTLAL